jgi:hypothetical protein
METKSEVEILKEIIISLNIEIHTLKESLTNSINDYNRVSAILQEMQTCKSK